MSLHDLVSKQKDKVSTLLQADEVSLGAIIFNNGDCQILSQSQERFELIVYDGSLHEPIEFAIVTDNKKALFP
jgi:hypothetical protein